ncbi:MAG: hypothetical protein RL497_970 [Pseudomonadota bacterium]
MSQTDSLQHFTVGDIEVSPQHNTLRHQSQTVTVQPKVMAVLYYLAQHQTRVVSNEELLDAVWHGRIVTLASVQKSINALRSALAELTDAQEFVVYFSKRGYQLMPKVRWSEASPAPLEPPQEAKAALNEEPPRRKPGAVYLWGALMGAVLLIGIVSLYATRPGVATGPGVTATQPGVGGPPQVTVSATKSDAPPVWRNVSIYLPDTSNAHLATPTPDGKRTAYVREAVNDGNHQSDLMIRDHSGQDWLLARSNSTWVDLAWSPSGRALAALEIYRADGLFSEPNFYQTPQYLYNFHLFTLDLKGQHLLEKNLLSQWQGTVNSITWWDENTLEFVASMGANTHKERYRYGVTDQTLTPLGVLASGYQPLMSRVLNKTTALLSRLQDKTQVEFLDEQQNLINKQAVDSSVRNLSWAPDARAVLALDARKNSIHYLPIHGQPSLVALPNPLSDMPHGSLGELSVHPAGKALLITAHTQTVPLYKQNAQGITPLTGANNSASTNLTGTNNLTGINYLIKNSVVYSPNGDAVVYATFHNNQSQLWLLNQNNTTQLHSSAGEIQTILWPSPEGLIIKIDNTLVYYQLHTHHWQTLVNDAEHSEPVAFSPATQTLWVVKLNNDVRNIWRIDAGMHKQLTFGQVGTVDAWNEVIYFQYANQQGLWKLNPQDLNHSVVNDQFPRHSQLLRVSAEAIYFVSGGPCHESDIQQFNLKHNTFSTYLKRQDNAVMSLAFAPEDGVLQVPCAANGFTVFSVHSG